MVLSRNRIKTGLFSPCLPGIGSFPYVLPWWLVDPYPLGMVYQRTSNLYRKFRFIVNFKVTQYFLTTVGPHFQWLEFHIKIRSMAGKQCVFSARKTGKGYCFLKLWLEFLLKLSGHPALALLLTAFAAGRVL